MAIAAGTLTAIVAAVALPTAAFAVFSNGPGLTDQYGGHAGAFVDGNMDTYCIDSNLNWPGGQSWSPSTVTSLAAPTTTVNGHPGVTLTGHPLGEANYVASKWGQTGDDNQSAAVWTALQAYTHGASAADVGTHYGMPAAVVSLAQSYMDEASTAPIGGAAVAAPTANGSMSFNVDKTNNYKGTGVVNTTVPAGSTLSVTLSVGTFSDGTTTKTETPGVPFDVIGDPTLAQAGKYFINGTATLSGTTVSGTPEELAVSDFTANGMQRVVAGTGVGGGTVPWSFTLNAKDPQPRTAFFQPVVTTKTSSKFVVAGQPATDEVTAETAPDASGLNNPWFINAGAAVNVKFDGTAYLSPVKIADGPALPANLPVVGTKSLTFGGAATSPAGTTQTATVTPKSGGYLYWMWKYSPNQDDVTPQVVPSGYAWADKVSQIESSIVPPSVTTQASSNPVGLPIYDTAIVDAPATADMGIGVRSKAYQGVATRDKATGRWTAGDNSKVCTGTPLFTTPTVQVTKPGSYKLADYVTKVAGAVVWQEELVDLATGNPIPGTQGKCGETSEISITPQVVVTTQAAQTVSAVGDQINDTTLVKGTITAGDHIRFQLYCVGTGDASTDKLLATTADVLVGPAGLANPVSVTGPSLANTWDCDKAYWVETYLNANGDVLAKDVPRAANESFTKKGVTPPTTPSISAPAVQDELPIVAG